MKRKKRKPSSGKRQTSRVSSTHSESQFSVHLNARLREGCLILTLALSLFLLIALFSYQPADPSWSHRLVTADVANAGGRAGAWMADFFLALFGYLAYLFPVMLSYAAWVFYRYRPEASSADGLKWPMLVLRTMGFVLVLIAACGLASLELRQAHAFLPSHAGGIIGTLVSGGMVSAFNSAGSTLILFSLLLIGVTLFTGLSWFQLMEQIGALTQRTIYSLSARVRQIDWRNLISGLWDALKGAGSKATPFKQEPMMQSSAPLASPVKPALASPEAPVDPARSLNPTNATKDKPKIAQLAERASVDVAELDRRAPRFSGSKVLPKLSLLDAPEEIKNSDIDHQQLELRSRDVEMRLADFGIEARVEAVYPGPVVTRYELELAAGTKVSKISGLAKDLARSLSVSSVRIVEVIPGKSLVGLELPNTTHEMVKLQEVLASQQYQAARSSLTLALGKDIAGHPVVVDLAKMPHLLVAGTTGSGKSVGLNAMLLSLLYKATPQDLRLILIDPKMLELSIYEGVPHLLTPVVTDMKDAATALRWCVVEMERRYRLMASLGVRNIKGYNAKVSEAIKKGSPLLDPLQSTDEDPVTLQVLPKIVVLADEFADMMVVVGKKVETLIARLAQKARAAGIHLIFATQRPSVDVITGLIKANIPTRIAFQVSSKIDSRTILDQQGAEQLLGNGDMLYLPPGTGVPMRVHGAYVTDEEVHRVVAYLKEHGEADYIEDVLDSQSGSDSSGYTDAVWGNGNEEGSEQDSLYDQAVDLVVRTRRVSISSIQRYFKIGYNRAARIVDSMEAAGVISAMEGSGNREVLAPPLQE